MNQVVINRHRIVAAPLTGIGWLAVQVWNDSVGMYKHLSTFRSRDEAEAFIEREERNA